MLTVIPGTLSAAAGELLGIGMGVMASHAAAGAVHTAVVPPGLDPTSAALVAAFHAHHVAYQAVHAEGAMVHVGTVLNLFASDAGYTLAQHPAAQILG
jgi:hypothetical protein